VSTVVDPRTPCIVGVAQQTWRGPDDAPEPLAMWEALARAAAEDAGAPAAVQDLQSVQLVNCLTWPYDDPAGRLAERLGAEPRHRVYSDMSGTAPLQLLAGTAAAVARGEVDLALVATGEALATMKRAKRAQRRLPWSHRRTEAAPIPAALLPHPTEVAHGVLQAYTTFALLDSARAAAAGLSRDAHRRVAGEVLARCNAVAATNPHAWLPQRRTAAELITPSADNRMVADPYTKYMVAVMDVDMAGALLLASHERADALGVPAEERVYVHAVAEAAEARVPAVRSDLASSVAMRAVFDATLAAAGTGIDDVTHLDLYSCFAASLLFAQDALGLPTDDPRPPTVTGGLPYAGGPASGYVVHALAAMVQRLRAEPGTRGLVSGVGMHMTKHAAAVLSTTPAPFGRGDADAIAAALAAHPDRRLAEHPTGPATIAAHTTVHGRDGTSAGVAICELPDGARCYATFDDDLLLAEAATTGLVGTSVTVGRSGRGTNVAAA
jgi:acetyl-CoA C-acetyltransferase